MIRLASHDLDLRGVGNLLGEEQSGHIKEVGCELCQQMLRKAIERLKRGKEEPAQDLWSPSISLARWVVLRGRFAALQNEGAGWRTGRRAAVTKGCVPAFRGGRAE
jgi:transcription-repair coupling factor (superfamily II helicase)